MSSTFDYALLGGGLQNGLIALALLARRPGVRVALVERDAKLGGNHRWSFHAGDASSEDLDILEPLIEQRWPGYEVAFPGLERALDEPYASFTSARLDLELRQRFADAPGCQLLLGVTARPVGGAQV